MEAQAIELVSEKQAAAALLGGDADGGGLAQLAGGALSLEAELAKSIAADEAVVDVTKLFRQTAQASADFTSGWATGGQVDEAAIKVVPLQNLVGKRFYHKADAHQVVDYGPLDEAAYKVKNLVSEAVALLPAEIVERAAILLPNAPLTLNQRRPQSGKPLVSAPASASAVTPLRQQYLNVKQQFPNAILFFRLGDFYQTFDKDAEVIARELDVVLTSRNVSKGQRVPMAGVPHHAAEQYICRLIEKGYHVAICEQTGDEPVNGLTPREVVRVVNPAPRGDEIVGGAPVVERQPNGIVITRKMLDLEAIHQEAQTSLPDVPALAGYHAAKRKHPHTLALVEREGAFYAYGEDARQIAKTLNAKLGTFLVEGAPVERMTIPAQEMDQALTGLARAGFKVALARQKNPRQGKLAVPPMEPTGEYALPATLEQAYARFRETERPNVLTFVEMQDAFVSFEGDAIAASQRLHRPHGVRALPGGPSLQVLSLPKGGHEAAFARLKKGNCTVALVDGRAKILLPEPRAETLRKSPQKTPLPPRRSPEQLREMSQGQLALL